MKILKRILNIFTPQKNGTPQFVDLGLPSGLKWAKCNVGAKKETDYGYYFQWGDIVNKRKSNCGWTKYKHCKGTKETMTKYRRYLLHGTVTDKSTLDPEDDAATQIMGGKWRMPTIAEFGELLYNTTKEWIQVNGVNGYKFTASNGNYIFIPAAGAYLNGSVDNVGNYGDVWSSSLNTSHPCNAWGLHFSADKCNIDYNARNYSLPVRGVMEKKISNFEK